jgi:hypothetical protein
MKEQPLEDQPQREYEETMREPEWVRDMLCAPWVTDIGKGGTIKIINADGLLVATMAPGNAEITTVIASVICDQVNKI